MLDISQNINNVKIPPYLIKPEYRTKLLESEIDFKSLRFHSSIDIFNKLNDITSKNDKATFLQTIHIFTIVRAVFKLQMMDKTRFTRDHLITEKELIKIAKVCGIQIDDLFNKSKKAFFDSEFVVNIHEESGTKYYEVANLSSYGKIFFEYIAPTNKFNFQFFKRESILCIAGKPMKTVKGHYGILGEDYLSRMFGVSQPAIHNVLKSISKIYCYAEISDEHLSALKAQGKQMLIDDEKLFLGSKVVYDAKYRIRMKNGVTRPVRYLPDSHPHHLKVYNTGDVLESNIILDKTSYYRLNEDSNRVMNIKVYQVIATSRKEAIEKIQTTKKQANLALRVKRMINYIESESNFKFHINMITNSTFSKLQQICGREVAKIMKDKNQTRKSKQPGEIAMWSKHAESIIGQQNVAKEKSLAQIVLNS